MYGSNDSRKVTFPEGSSQNLSYMSLNSTSLKTMLHLRNKSFSLSLHSLAKTEANSENPRRSRGFSPARELPQTLLRFSPGYEGTENMFYFFYRIIIFRLNKEKDDIRSAHVFFNFFHETVNSHNLGQPIILLIFLCFIAL